jgi:hypothetical protein
MVRKALGLRRARPQVQLTTSLPPGRGVRMRLPTHESSTVQLGGEAPTFAHVAA